MFNADLAKEKIIKFVFTHYKKSKYKISKELNKMCIMYKYLKNPIQN